jgi:hypothetical protein
MPIKVFISENGKLIDRSQSFIHFGSAGWWNRIYATDMDGDGDTDLIVGNCGLNNQFHPSTKEPMTLYYKDFDSNGSIDPILCYYIDGVSYPAASRDDITDQLSGLKKKFLAYKDYANATIHDLFSEDQLKDAGVLKAEMLQTLYLENTAHGFIQHALPIEAQYSPVYAIAAADLNNDGKKDLLLAGNNTWTRIKFGRYQDNHGQLFLNTGSSSFKYLPQFESGLNIRDNVRSINGILIGSQASFICGINNSTATVIKVKEPTKFVVEKRKLVLNKTFYP